MRSFVDCDGCGLVFTTFAELFVVRGKSPHPTAYEAMAFFLVRCQQLRKDPERSSTNPTHKKAIKPEATWPSAQCIVRALGTVETQNRTEWFFFFSKALKYSLGGKECFGFLKSCGHRKSTNQQSSYLLGERSRTRSSNTNQAPATQEWDKHCCLVSIPFYKRYPAGYIS